ncbi:hypothetical protein GCM10023201_15200 [Actinomycetospora corticicola]|uniref:Uncharacterized protein n=1 Tax=Actinomycetospora corticicola TaxID=663602 RepID=A0A7Y9DVR5_9PSEU|nr:hypothetical protein [Actinomycetospora corticicola]NYD36122.1 hypothetical protein [Actinomycetospora corticicola]
MSADPDPTSRPLAPEPLADAFAVADQLAVHGSDCVCPRCAGRLPFLLRDLARALDGADGPDGSGRSADQGR